MSGSLNQTSAIAAAPYSAASTKISRQLPNAISAVPSIGAAIGATPITIISSENSLAAAGPSARSRTMARGSTTLAEAPSAARTRNSAKEAVLQARAQPIEARV